MQLKFIILLLMFSELQQNHSTVKKIKDCYSIFLLCATPRVTRTDLGLMFVGVPVYLIFLLIRPRSR